MGHLRTLRTDVTDESFRSAVLVGLASVPFTVGLSWQLVVDEVFVAGGSVSGIPLLLAGLLVGYLYSTREVAGRRAGFVAGIAGSVAVAVLYVLNALTTVTSESTGIAVLAVVATPFLLALGAVLCGLFAAAGAVLGGWLAEQGAGVGSARDSG